MGNITEMPAAVSSRPTMTTTGSEDASVIGMTIATSSPLPRAWCRARSGG